MTMKMINYLPLRISKLRKESVKIEDEVTDIICEECGRNMVIKYGPHGKFLACPGFPECKNYVLHPSKGVLSPRSESVAQARKSLKEMIPEAKAMGVRLCVENLVGSLCYSTEEMENTISGIDDAWVTYDIGHANCKGYDVVQWLEYIGPRLGTVHMHDTKFGSGNDSHSLLGDSSLGSGCIKQWEDVIRTMLEDNRYRGVFMFELSGKNPNTVMASYEKIVADYVKKYETK